LKLYGEPEYKSSGCMLTVEKDFARLSSGNEYSLLGGLAETNLLK
jgi:hypothetical protein